jgi:glycine cleavage system aminomethyltransferase T
LSTWQRTGGNVSAPGDTIVVGAKWRDLKEGLDLFINRDKDFIGKAAAQKERETGATIRLVTMTIGTDGTDVTPDEAILKDGECVGYMTPGGYAHHVQQSMALGYVPAALATDGTELEIEINGEMYSARVVGGPYTIHQERKFAPEETGVIPGSHRALSNFNRDY